MPTLFAYRGLPASGKSTHAAAWVAEDPTHRARVNRDSLRNMLHDGYHGGSAEALVTAASHAAITDLLRKGTDVACDDTNLRQRVIRDLASLAKKAKADFQVRDFTDVPIEVCVERDLKRQRTVGEQVIRDMHTRYLKGRTLPLPPPEEPADASTGLPLYEVKPGTPRAVLVDIDGTVALMSGRSPFDETRVSEDQPNRAVIHVVRALHAAGNRIVFLSGRTAGCRAETEMWLTRHVAVPFDGLHMRPVGDSRKDSIVKAELFDTHVRDVYDVTCVLDDRDQVVRAWREMGLTVLQVAEGNF
jgi:predicted kinase